MNTRSEVSDASTYCAELEEHQPPRYRKQRPPCYVCREKQVRPNRKSNVDEIDDAICKHLSAEKIMNLKEVCDHIRALQNIKHKCTEKRSHVTLRRKLHKIKSTLEQRFEFSSLNLTQDYALLDQMNTTSNTFTTANLAECNLTNYDFELASEADMFSTECIISETQSSDFVVPETPLEQNNTTLMSAAVLTNDSATAPYLPVKLTNENVIPMSPPSASEAGSSTFTFGQKDTFTQWRSESNALSSAATSENTENEGQFLLPSQKVVVSENMEITSPFLTPSEESVVLNKAKTKLNKNIKPRAPTAKVLTQHFPIRGDVPKAVLMDEMKTIVENIKKFKLDVLKSLKELPLQKEASVGNSAGLGCNLSTDSSGTKYSLTREEQDMNQKILDSLRAQINMESKFVFVVCGFLEIQF